jgi:hypothetical protein
LDRPSFTAERPDIGPRKPLIGRPVRIVTFCRWLEETRAAAEIP